MENAIEQIEVKVRPELLHYMGRHDDGLWIYNVQDAFRLPVTRWNDHWDLVGYVRNNEHDCIVVDGAIRFRKYNCIK